jgi:hypothetical protein
MTNITLGVDEESMKFSYHGKKIVKAQANRAYVEIPEVMTLIEMGGDLDEALVEEGIAFSPVYHLATRKTISEGGTKTWLRLQKAH